MTRAEELAAAVELAKTRQREALAGWRERSRCGHYADSDEFFAARNETIRLLHELDRLRADEDSPAR